MSQRGSSYRTSAFLLSFWFIVTELLVVGVPSIWGSSEAREAQVVSVILREGEWILPLRNGQIPSKPPLLHWLAASIGEVLGFESPVLTRIVSIVSGTLLLFLLFRLAAVFHSRIFPNRRNERAIFTIITGAILITSYSFVRMASDGRVDMLFSVLCFAGLLNVIIGLLERGDVAPFSFTLLWIFAGFASITKGPLGAAIPLTLAFTSYAYLCGVRRALFEFFKPRIGWILFILIVLPWYFIAYHKGGEAFFDRQLVFENLKRLVGGERVNGEPWWFYIPSFLLSAPPWSILFIIPIVQLCKRWKDRDPKCLPTLLVCVGVVLFSFSTGKRHSYLLPFMPYVALSVAEFIYCFVFKARPALVEWFSFRRRVFDEAAIIILCFAAAIIPLSRQLLFSDTESIGIAVSWLGAKEILLVEGFSPIPIVLLGFFLFRRSREESSLFFFASSVSAVMILGSVFGLGIKGELKGFSKIGREISNLVEKNEKLSVVKDPWDEYFDPIIYYLHREVILRRPDELPEACGDGLVLAYLSFLKSRTEISASTVMEFSEVSAKEKGEGRKTLVLFRCSAPVLEAQTK